MIKHLVDRYDLAITKENLLEPKAFAIGSTAPLFRFKVYHTREAAEADGHVLAPYSVENPVKSWADPKPPPADEFGDVTYLMIATTRNGCGDVALTGPDGKPYLRNYKMSREEASTLNIPPKGDFPDKPQPKGEWNVPCRPLNATEQLSWGFGGIPVVQDKATVSTAPTPGSPVDISQVMVALEEMGAKLDIVIANTTKG